MIFNCSLSSTRLIDGETRRAKLVQCLVSSLESRVVPAEWKERPQSFFKEQTRSTIFLQPTSTLQPHRQELICSDRYSRDNTLNTNHNRSHSATMADRYIPEHRRTQFKAKNTFKPDELRRRREEQQVEIRKAKREENLAKRRGITTGDGSRPGASLGAEPDSDDDTAPTESQVS